MELSLPAVVVVTLVGSGTLAALAWIGIAVGLFGLFQAGVLIMRCWGY